jgi:hypothetical protein
MDDTLAHGRIPGIFVISASDRPSYARTMSAERQVTVHRFEASLFPVNAYLVETGLALRSGEKGTVDVATR